MMTDELFNRIIKRLISNADDALKNAKKEPDIYFYKGVKFEYYEALYTIKNDLEIEEYDVEQCGLDIEVDMKYLFGK